MLWLAPLIHSEFINPHVVDKIDVTDSTFISRLFTINELLDISIRRRLRTI